MIVVVDYGRGNLFSLNQALGHHGIEHCVSGEVEDIQNAHAIILPGVGAFGDAMDTLHQKKLVQPLQRAAEMGTPLMGICLGMQLLFDSSDEFGSHKGLGLIAGTVTRLPTSEKQDAIRIPNVGWRKLHTNQQNRFGSMLHDNTMMYFVHSYAANPENPAHIAATIPVNGHDVTVSVNKDNIFGCQFHPEKSGPEGLEILRIFSGVVYALKSKNASFNI